MLMNERTNQLTNKRDGSQYLLAEIIMYDSERLGVQLLLADCDREMSECNTVNVSLARLGDSCRVLLMTGLWLCCFVVRATAEVH